MDVYVIRHGETDWNVEGKLQGREDIPLNENGILQAIECQKALRKITFVTIQTSPLLRAKKTAEIIALPHECPLVINYNLIERDYGRLSGLTPRERQIVERQEYPTKVEPWDVLALRAYNTVQNLAKLYPQGSVAVVSHGAWINALLAVVSNRKVGTGKTKLKNVCINLLRKESSGWKIGFLNLTAEELRYC